MLSKFSKNALLALPLLGSVAFAARSRIQLESRDLDFDYNNEKIRGVNIGGWLVTEPWITPSLYDAAPEAAVDEWTFCETLGAEEAKARLSKHWETWINQDDFAKIAQAGMNHVRIPIGYWAVSKFEDEPYVDGQLEYMDKAINWAREAGLKVLVDLHGAPGSQNGFDNSGRRGPIEWKDQTTLDQTVDVFHALVERYAKYTDVVTAIEAINEPNIPAGVPLEHVQEYHTDAFNTLRKQDDYTVLVMHDGFNPVDSWNGFLSGEYMNVMMDTHHYQVFDSGSLAMDINGHVGTVCALGSDHYDRSDKWAIGGEWSGALTDCAKYLNGKGLGARWDGTFAGSSPIGSCDGKRTGTVAALPAEDRDNIRRFIEAQIEVFEQKNGWLFWTWKTEGAPEWDMQQLLDEGVFPNPVSQRTYGNQCS